MTRKSHLPCCPNHGEPLEGIGFPIPHKGTGVCPVSGASFDFEIELDQATIVRNKDGSTSKEVSFNVTGEEK